MQHGIGLGVAASLALGLWVWGAAAHGEARVSRCHSLPELEARAAMNRGSGRVEFMAPAYLTLPCILLLCTAPRAG